MALASGQLILGIGYLVVCVACAAQVTVTWWRGHSMWGFRVGFLALSSFWTLLKGVAWLSLSSLPAGFAGIIGGSLPTVGQLASYLFFIGFCAQQVHSATWGQHSVRFWVLFATAMVTAMGATIVFGTVVGSQNDSSSGAGWDPQKSEEVLRFEEALSAAVHSLLATLLAVYGWLVWRGHRVKHATTLNVSFRTGFVKPDDRVSGIVPILFAVSAAFAARTVYDVLLAASVVPPVKLSTEEGDPKEIDIVKYGIPFYLAVDLGPTLLLLMYFRAIPRTPSRPRHIPQTAGGGGGSNQSSGPSVLPAAARVFDPFQSSHVQLY